MLCRCLFSGQCRVMSPSKILNLDLGSFSKYLVKPGLGCFSHILKSRQAVSVSWGRLTLEGANGRQDSGSTKAELDPALANASASSFSWIPQCPGIHTSRTLLDKVSSRKTVAWKPKAYNSLTFKMSENTPVPALPRQRDPSVKYSGSFYKNPYFFVQKCSYFLLLLYSFWISEYCLFF
jgi:hypothetical protein